MMTRAGACWLQITAAVNAVRWKGSAPPGLDDLEQSDPEEATKLRSLLRMQPEALDEWLQVIAESGVTIFPACLTTQLT